MGVGVGGDRSSDGGAGGADTGGGGFDARRNESQRIGKKAIMGTVGVGVVSLVVVVLHSQILRPLLLTLPPATGELPGEWSPPTIRSEIA